MKYRPNFFFLTKELGFCQCVLPNINVKFSYIHVIFVVSMSLPWIHSLFLYQKHIFMLIWFYDIF